MHVVAGLGNPGDKFHGTRHNIGFYIADRLAEEMGMRFRRIAHKAHLAEGFLEGEKVILAKPQTYMNLSGQSVSDLVRFYKLPTEGLIVVYDDIDLPCGTLRIRTEGGAGTHNGMRSILYQLATEAFPRVRVGVGRPPEGWDLADFVLSRFQEAEIPLVKEACDRAVTAILHMIRHGAADAMSRYNG